MLELTDMLTPLITLVGFLAVIYNLNNAMKNNKRIDEKEVEMRAANQAETNIMLREVSNDVKAIMTKLDTTEERVNSLETRVTISESGIKEIIRNYEKVVEDIRQLRTTA